MLERQCLPNSARFVLPEGLGIAILKSGYKSIRRDPDSPASDVNENVFPPFLQVEFVAEGVKMELIDAARSGAAGAAAWGKMEFHCREPRASDPITFTTRDSHLVSIIPSALLRYEK
ncbi:hypothetical protein K0M31_013988 [Melipona bicolor]|uniref:Uncharacterized protein n=1 Tax=Melipona bicolor TaxID=60889 RepID=A0AA40G7P9_9HYME|nr:hypothetical protein K0M31_013988 [Melipona bicolor]